MAWNEAFKWSSQYVSQDPNNKPQLKPLSKEDFEFLEKAFESVMVNETKEIIKLLNKLKEEDEIKGDQLDCDQRVEIVEEIKGYVDGLEVARNIVRCNRFEEIIKLFFQSVHFDLKLEIASLLSRMMQNDKHVQIAALKFGILDCLLYLKNNEIYNYKDHEKLVSKVILIISGFVNGECIESKRAFAIENDGLELLSQIFEVFPMIRILRIWEELTKPEVEKDYTELNKQIVQKFLEKKLNHFIIHNLLNDYKSNPNDNDEHKQILQTILKQTSFMWTDEDYTLYKQAVLEIQSFSITNEEIKANLSQSQAEVDLSFNTKSINMDHLNTPFEFQTMPDGGKVITLSKDEDSTGTTQKILSLGI